MVFFEYHVACNTLYDHMTGQGKKYPLFTKYILLMTTKDGQKTYFLIILQF